MKSKLKIFLSWLFVIIVIIVIFSFSSQNADKSTSVSDGFIDNTLGSINNGQFLEKLENKYSYNTVSGYVRKLGHVFEYSVLGLFAYNAFNITFRKKRLVTIIYTTLFISFVAGLDELYQGLSDRTSSIKDVGIDTLGGIIGIFGMIFFYFVINLIKLEFDKNKKIKLIITK